MLVSLHVRQLTNQSISMPLLLLRDVLPPAVPFLSQSKQVDEKEQAIILTDRGYDDCDKVLGKSIFDPKDPWAPFIINSLKAKELFTKDKVRLPHVAALFLHPLVKMSTDIEDKDGPPDIGIDDTDSPRLGATFCILLPCEAQGRMLLCAELQEAYVYVNIVFSFHPH